MTAPDVPLWVQLDAALDALFDSPESDRPALLARLTADTPGLRPELERMLQADAIRDGLLDGDLVKIGADLFGAARADSAAEESPARVGRYRIVRELGRGGMGTVHLGERDDGEFQQTVAVKLLKRGMDTDEILRRFFRERQILARLEHPNIARVIDGGATDDGRPYVVMEYVSGEPITVEADRRRLPLRARLALFAQACEAVSFAQRHLVVHRDLKPSNILVTQDGQVKLLDFGIAKLLDPADGDALTVAESGAQLLTPAYASPEQLCGDPVTTATDVYALGIILYELLVGSHPFRESGLGKGGRAANREPRPLSQAVTSAAASTRRSSAASLRRQLQGDLATIVAKALREESHLRYPTAAALRDDLDRYRTGMPVAARLSSLRYRVYKYLRRHRVELAATAAVIVALCAGLIGTTWQSRVAAREAARANEVRAFLVGLFEAADPDAGHGVDPTATELLRRGSERVDRELANDPAMRAELLSLLGNLHERLGNYDLARPLLARALDLRRELHGDASPEVRSALFDLGSLDIRLAAYARADSLLRAALTRFDPERDASGEELARLYNDLGVLRARLDDAAQAEEFYRRSLAIRLRVYGDDHPEVASALDNLGVLLAVGGRNAEAETLHRKALAIRLRHLSPEHTSIAVSQHNLAFAVARQGRAEEAERLYRDAISLRRRLHPDGHPDLAGTLRQLAQLLAGNRRLDEASALLVEAVAMNERRLSGPHVDAAMTWNELALVAYRRADYNGAAEGFAAALSVFESLLPDDHPTLLLVENNTAGSLRQAGRFAEAEQRYLNLLSRRARRAAAGQSDPLGPQDLLDAGATLRLRGNLDAAIPALREAATRRQGDPNATARGRADANHELGLALAAAGDVLTARALQEAAVAAYTAELSPGDPRLLAARAALAQLQSAR